MSLSLARRSLIVIIAACALVAGCGSDERPAEVEIAASTSYDDLVALFADWRAFAPPPRVDGVPDYSAETMAAQQADLERYRRRLDGIDSSGWPVAQQVDHVLVQAEMNGLDFDHRVRRPWANNPAFYTMIFSSQSDVPAHEGPVIDGWVDLWAYDYPLSAADGARLAGRIRIIPPLLDQARANLVGTGRDLWRGGIRAMQGQQRDLDAFAAGVAGASAALDEAIQVAAEATDRFRLWLEDELPAKNGPSGVGKADYTWYLQRVHLVPYTWEEEVAIMRHELARSHASLRLEEHRNRGLPPLPLVATAEEYDLRFDRSVDEFLGFLDDEQIVTVRDDAAPALRAKIGSFSPAPADGPRGFFSEVSYRDPLAMRTHSYHWAELARMANEPHTSPIRRGPSLFNIFDQRSEGLATGMEEWTLHAGLFDDRPRSRELIYIMLAQRAARALSGLMMHGHEYTIDEAAEFAAEWTPRGWMPPDSDTVWGEQHLYLQQPGYGTSYIIGKIEIEKLMAEWALAQGDDFTIKGFLDEFSAAGVIPVSLVRWELTGDDSEIRRMLQ